MREPLLEILGAALEAVDGRRCTRATLPDQLAADAGFNLVAIGKAAPAMVQGALDVEAGRLRSGLVITRRGATAIALPADHRLQVIEGSHPLPDQRSLDAGAALLRYVDSLAPGGQVVCLISGGTSSLVEVLPDGVSLDELRRLNEWLLGSGLAIQEINALRRRLSTIKDGGLADRMGDREVIALYVSDVPHDEPADIGSGLLKRVTRDALPAGLPTWVEKLVSVRHGRPEDRAGIRHEIVANLDQALTTAARKARQLGYAVTLHPERLEGDSSAMASRIARTLATGPDGVHLWGGETTPRLPPEVGRGGRNQHLALCCAMEICGRTDLRVLCVATDGSDGNTDDAGGMVDGATVDRGRDAGLDPRRCLDRADSGRFLEAAGDIIDTGPTGTNVTDLVIGLRCASG